MNDYSPRELLERTLRFWWILAGLAILGGLAGWVFSNFRPPIYEASADFDVSLDQQQLVKDGLVTEDKLPLNYTAQDVFFSPVADVFFASEVKSQFISDARTQGISLSGNVFSSTDFHVDQQVFRWFITVRSTDPIIAANLANLWVADAYPFLLEARAHTAEALSLELQRDSIQKCFSGMDFTRANQCAGTTFTGAADLDSYLGKLELEVITEQQAGRGIDPALSFVIGNPAQPPPSPILYSEGLIILAGCMLGLLVGLLVSRSLPAPVDRK